MSSEMGGMSHGSDLEQSVAEAKVAEKAYDWLTSIALYDTALLSVNDQDFPARGEVCERLGYAFYRAAMQSHSKRVFRRRCLTAAYNYRTAVANYAKISPSKGKPRMLRCEAMSHFLRYWVELDVSSKKSRIDECWRISKDALGAFDKNAEPAEFGKSFNLLSTCVGFVFAMESNSEIRKQIMGEVIELGYQALAFKSSLKEDGELATVCSRMAAFLGCFGRYFLDPVERERFAFQQSDHWARARQISEETAFIELVRSPMLWPIEEWGAGTDKALSNFEKALEFGVKAEDKFVIGYAHDWLAFNTYWKATNEEDQNTARKLFETALRHIKKARSNYSCINFSSIRGNSFGVEIAHADYFHELANRETDEVSKRGFLENAVKAGRQGFGHASNSNCIEILTMAQHSLSRILASLAKIEMSPERKKALLEEALAYRTEVVRSVRRIFPVHYWDQAFMVRYLVEIKSALAELDPNPDIRKRILEEAVVDAEGILQPAVSYASFYEKVGSKPMIGATGGLQYEVGDLLVRLCEITKDEECLKRAISSYEDASKTFAKLDIAGRVAKCFWKSARCHELLNNHLSSAAGFRLAAENFSRASKEFPQFERFYNDHSLYMRAWSEIEKAKYYHKRQEYSIAKRCFERAAKIHRMLESWRYLVPNYLAWARVEHAEDLSTRDRPLKAIRVFREASDLFGMAANSIRAELSKIEPLDEKHMADVLLHASVARSEYCRARILLEEAKNFAKEGDHFSSSEKYLLTANALEKLLPEFDFQQDRNEVAYLINLSYAWQKMMLAESKASPELYIEASQLFEKASELSSTERVRYLVLGHSHFCRSLEAGAKFVDTWNRDLYSETLQCLQCATSYYQRARSDNLVDYAKATGLLFEAYLRLDDAQREMNPPKKLKLFTMAEMVLQSAAGVYTKNGYLEKREQVLTLMKKIKEDRQLTASLCGVLGLPVSHDASFRAPTPTSEVAIGLGKFEHARIEANLIAPTDVALKEQFDVCLDMVNVAEHVGLLVRVEELIPAGFRVVSLSPQLRLTGNSFDLCGRRLEPLKVESIRIRIMANEPGSFVVNPRIVYVDDAGTFKDCRPKSICMVVRPKLMLEFRSDSARKAFTFLTSSFVEDHLRHGMPLESSGWRTMSEIVVAEKMPKTEVYGVDGRRGSAYSELLRSGLIEERLFLGVRGRGGRILKTRVACDKEAVKDYLDSEMVKIRTRDAQIMFDFLTDCFVEDYVRRRVSVENSGWRTRSEIVNQASVSRSSVRKRIRVEGPAVSELRKDGLIEAKVIPNERGRGRKVMKVRICYGKEAIRRHIAKRIVEK